MMNTLWAVMVIFSVVTAFFSGSTAALTNGIFSGASDSVQLILTLIGALTLWSGLAEIADKSGLSGGVNRLLSPLLSAVFPSLDRDSPAFRAICMNVTANLLGLGNAATPLGLRAMEELQKENPGDPETATGDMIRFVVMNTASIQLIPTTAAALRAEAGSETPFDILLPVWVVSLLSLGAGLGVAVLLSGKKRKLRKQKAKKTKAGALYGLALPALLLALPAGFANVPDTIGNAALPVVVGGILLWGLVKKTPVFDCFLSGAKNGLSTAAGLLPSLCALVTAVSMLQTSGAMALLVRLLTPVGNLLGIPPELLPLCLLRPLSGSGGVSVYQNILSTYGADSLLARQAAVISGASETTFYAMTVYYGSIGVKNTGCTLPAALLSDWVCYIAACRMVR